MTPFPQCRSNGGGTLRWDIDLLCGGMTRGALTFSWRTRSDPDCEDCPHHKVRDELVGLVDAHELSRATLEDGPRHAGRHEKAEPDEEADDDPADDSGWKPDVRLATVLEEDTEDERCDDAADEPRRESFRRLLSHRLPVRFRLAEGGHPGLPEHRPGVPDSPDHEAHNRCRDDGDEEGGIERQSHLTLPLCAGEVPED